MGKKEKEVWIVDDEPELAELLAELLSQEFRVRFFSCATSALEYFQNTGQKPDIILTDIKMPELDGIEFLKKWRQTVEDTDFSSRNMSVRAALVPFVFFTGLLDISGIRQFASTPMVTFICKPSQYEKIVQVLNEMISKAEHVRKNTDSATVL